MSPQATRLAPAGAGKLYGVGALSRRDSVGAPLSRGCMCIWVVPLDADSQRKLDVRRRPSFCTQARTGTSGSVSTRAGRPQPSGFGGKVWFSAGNEAHGPSVRPWAP